MKIKIYSFLCDTQSGFHSYLHTSIESLVADICDTLESYVEGITERLKPLAYNSDEWWSVWDEVMAVCNADGDYFSVSAQDIDLPAPAMTERTARIKKLAEDEVVTQGGSTVEFDEVPVISEGGDNGAFVQGWFWVSFQGEAGLDKEEQPA